MSNVQIKNVDADLHEQLRKRATAEGTSLSEYVLELIRRDLRKPTRREWLAKVRTLRPIDTTTEEIVALRDAGRDR
jgi:antitoxin FitA